MVGENEPGGGDDFILLFVTALSEPTVRGPDDACTADIVSNYYVDTVALKKNDG